MVEFRNLVTEFDGTKGKYDQALINSIYREANVQGEELQEEEEEEEEKEKDEKENQVFEEEEEAMVNVVLKADNIGSLHTLIDACNELSTQGAKVNIVRAGVGNVSTTDVAYAVSAGGSIYTFNVGLTHDIKLRKDKLKIRIKHFDVFYHLLDDLKKEQEALK